MISEIQVTWTSHDKRPIQIVAYESWSEFSQLIKQAVPEIHFVFLTFSTLSFWLEFIDKTGENVFCLQMQIKLKPCITLFSWLVHKKT